MVKLSNEINQNNHHIFVDLDSYRGEDYYVQNVNKNYYFTKPTDETGTDVPIWGEYNKIQIVGNNGKYSQQLERLTAHHTIYGHSSYLVLATLENEVTQPVEPTKLKQDLIALRQRLSEIIEELP